MAFDIIHSLINIISSGRSDIKIFLFLAYLAVLALSLLLLKGKCFARKLSWQWPVFSLLGVYIYGFCLQLYLTVSRNIPFNKPFIVLDNGDMSSSVLWHTHIAKGIIGQIASFLRYKGFSNIDSGGAYVGLLPAWIFLAGAVLLVSAMALVFFYFLSSFRRQVYSAGWWRGSFLLLSFAILSFAAIETSVDGGFFTRGFFVAAIYIILASWRKDDPKRSLAGTSSLLFLAILLLALGAYKYGVDVVSGGAFFVLAAMLFYGSGNKCRAAILIVLFGAFLASWWLASSRDRSVYSYASTVIPASQEVYYYDGSGQGGIGEYVSLKGETVREIAKRLDKNLTYKPIAVKGYTCDPDSPMIRMSAYAIASQPFSDPSASISGYILIRPEESFVSGGRYWTKLDIAIDPCAPEPFSLIKLGLKRAGLDSLLLYGLEFI